MSSELSIRMRDEGPQGTANVQRDAPAPSSRVELRVIEWLCQPLLLSIPRGVHPSSISLLTHCIGWLTMGLALASVHLTPLGRSLALIGAGFGMLASMAGDCLCSMHARNTDQSSKLGEMTDRWLDAIVVPMAPIGITVALQMPGWAIVAVSICAAMVYHAQLVLYHHTGKFVHPEPATGTEAQLGLATGYVGISVLFYFVGRDHGWLDMAIAALAVFGLYIELRCNWFYYARLGRLVRHHVPFVALCAGFGALHLLGAIELPAFALLLICTSFRLSGSYVLSTVVRRPYHGQDYGIYAWLAAMFLAHYALPPLSFGPLTLQAALPLGACLYMLVRNLGDFSRFYPVLKP
jgi:phosphatidylglycerophosphate synthase